MFNVWKQFLKQFLNEKIEEPILYKGGAVCSKHCDCGACPNEMFKTVLILTIIFIVYVYYKGKLKWIKEERSQSC